ncbi:carbonic anhydrase 1-like [Lycorma delicatula]|uniref:carbonic anhydrase 1-like n=1 Tax=Lycorma delicatula TaxID=130591 RepID=UPI003F515604
MHLAPSSLLLMLLTVLIPEILAGDWHYSEEQWTGQCSEGKKQSPIDLQERIGKRERVEPLIFLHYNRPVQANLTNNGHTVVLNVEQYCEVAVAAGGLRGLYQLDEIHFHWEAEHTIDKKRLPLEVHFVHHNILYNNITQALFYEQGLAVVAVLFHETEQVNTNMVPVLEALEESADTVGDITALTSPFSPSALLPDDRNSFFRYQGSLTTPPCTEAVIWTVLHKTVPISKLQLEKFRTVNTTAGLLDANFRPTQPLNSRTVYLMSDNLIDDNETASAQKFKCWSYIILIIPMILCSSLRQYV